MEYWLATNEILFTQKAPINSYDTIEKDTEYALLTIKNEIVINHTINVKLEPPLPWVIPQNSN